MISGLSKITDMSKKTIQDLTVVCIDTYNVGEAIIAIRKTLNEITPTKTLFFTNSNVEIDGVETIVIDEINSVDDYSKFVIKKLHKYITTDFVLIIQHDGYVLNGDLFDEELKNYDYCGALWEEKDGLNNGNGGFSWRSKTLLEAIANDPVIEILTPEDVSICRIYRRYLEGKYQLEWAPNELAEKFSYELIKPKNRTFGFHSYHHQPYKPNIVIQRMGAMGDVIGVEPVLEHFHNKGYNVILKTTIDFYQLFMQHKYKITFYENFDTSEPHHYFNLDMSYESKPLQHHLKTYFEFCNVIAFEMKQPRLYFEGMNMAEHKIFDKYIIIHNDQREQPHRNIAGFDFGVLAKALNHLGYVVFQVGTSQERIPNTIKLNTKTLYFLKQIVSQADWFIGIDSGISHIARAFDVPSIIFSGSVNLKLIHVDFNNLHWIKNNVCETPHCWHNVVGCTGQDCYIDKQKPPCCNFGSPITMEFIINKIKYKTNVTQQGIAYQSY
jgi:hypothetical protein